MQYSQCVTLQCISIFTEFGTSTYMNTEYIYVCTYIALQVHLGIRISGYQSIPYTHIYIYIQLYIHVHRNMYIWSHPLATSRTNPTPPTDIHRPPRHRYVHLSRSLRQLSPNRTVFSRLCIAFLRLPRAYIMPPAIVSCVSCQVVVSGLDLSFVLCFSFLFGQQGLVNAGLACRKL